MLIVKQVANALFASRATLPSMKRTTIGGPPYLAIATISEKERIGLGTMAFETAPQSA
jgi:hypothetical protein